MHTMIQTGHRKRKGESDKMVKLYRPEGGYMDTAENREYLASPSGLERAMNAGAIIEGIATRCDENMRLHVDLQPGRIWVCLVRTNDVHHALILR